MKYVFLLAGVALVYFVLVRSAPVSQVKEAIVHPEAADSRINLKRPIDRTNQVLEKVKTRNGDGEF
jgi:hypothetical protein